MTRLLAVAALALAACAPVAANAGVEPAGPARANPPALFVMDGGMAVRAENGARIAIANGWVEPRFSPFPPGPRTELDILVLSESGAPADVVVTYEMLDMGHGAMADHAMLSGAGHHVAHLDLSMQGTWRFKIRVVVDGVTSTVVLLLSDTLL